MYRLKYYLFVSLSVLLASCSEQYNISGDSTVSALDGRMLYLKVLTSNDHLRDLDSCEVIHGKFNFMGMIDSICMGELCMDDESVMPIVIENANLNIKINNVEQKVTGGSLNNRLYRFLEQKSQIENQIIELSNREARLILSGASPSKVHKQLAGKADKLYSKIENLETAFIINNNNNILGTTYFMMLCSQYPYPILTSQIKQIIEKTSPSFHRQPFVSNYIRAAESNMRFLRQTHPSDGF